MLLGSLYRDRTVFKLMVKINDNVLKIAYAACSAVFIYLIFFLHFSRIPKTYFRIFFSSTKVTFSKRTAEQISCTGPYFLILFGVKFHFA